MARLTRIVLTLVSAIGFSMVAPASSQAGSIWWPGYSGATYAGYRGWGSQGCASGNCGLGATTVSYAPMASYVTGCNCSQSVGYAAVYGQTGCGCSSCGSCSGGNCNSCLSGNCSSCAGGNCGVPVGVSGSTSAGYPTPIPMPSSSNTNTNHQPSDINKRLDKLERTQTELFRFLRTKHPDELKDDPYLNSGRSSQGFGSNDESDDFSTSRTRKTFSSEEQVPAKPWRKGSSPLNDANEESRKPPIDLPPNSSTEEQNSEIVPAKDETPARKEEVPAAFYQHRNAITGAVAPRERMSSKPVTSQPKTNVAKAKRSAKTALDSSLSTDLVRY